ncbi:MAG TPA: hypothetical protein VF715_02160 [Thermoleophilaceae bacterium]
MRPRLSYANVVSTLALVFALGTGGAWAATQIHGNLIKKNTITGSKLKKTTITHREINEKKMKAVPRALLADNAQNANVAQVANTLAGGLPPSAFVQGGGTQLTGRTTAPAADGTNVVKTFQTPVGEFRLSCNNASADVRYFNTTAGDADVFRFNYGAAVQSTTYNVEPSGGGTGLGLSTTAANGPHYSDIRAGKGEQTAILRVGQRREGLNCIWNWELVSP